MVFLPASGTDDATELPFGDAESAEQAAAGAVALLAENTEPGLAIAERAQGGVGVAVKRQVSVGTREFRIGLQEGKA
jgi:hypothetical protein